MLTVDLVGLSGGQVGVGDKRVIPPHREQRVGVAGVADPATTSRAVRRPWPRTVRV